ncbi:GNAT family N-acetyltransferase [Alicyclobacillus dauci]|uniref:GNAT family N-acetyltransferase n=1 Tax=Alicyclobacillus dauci TaxID=1475485 RepID=A0ABY6Z564_9BACL|nr:GNAT family N-acetyltransferase [Alicyclobacillus dauci]WAH37995.1 GNAT family N-acetyltransferase [Alicyclobacillus dauci]
MSNIVIRQLSTLDQLKNVQELEKRIWGPHSLPIHQTITAVKNGGIILGAFDGPTLVGYLYSFAGFKAGEVYLCSHQMGIDEVYRKQGIGYQLKMAQAKLARDVGYRKIRWTYDPLEAHNAYLNIGKLGAICSDYIENCYGPMNDDLNRGLPSDRFWVTWFTDGNEAISRQNERDRNVSRRYADSIILQSKLQDGMPVAIEFDEIEADKSYLLVPIPTDFQRIKRRSHDLAVEWRMFTRRVFTRAFQTGWTVVDTVRDQEILYYVLQRLG